MLFVIGVFLLFVSVGTEAYIYLNKNGWNKHRRYSVPALILLVLSSTIMLISNFTAWLLLAAFISIYRFINLARVRYSRIPEKHLKSIAPRSFVVLILLQTTAIMSWLIFVELLRYSLPVNSLANIFVTASLLASIMILITTIIKLHKGRPTSGPELDNTDLPTVTVAIAARNETPHLVSCLQSVVNSDYPKLEILVLDDDSQDTTAEIIKSFAHDGVRFVKHENFEGEWLAKNAAYQTLLNGASGEYVLYMGVDARLHKTSIRRAVEQLLPNNLSMLTILPKRNNSGFVAVLVQPMRYWWMLSTPKFIIRRPPALSTSWMVNKAALDKIGGFKTYKRSITPESHLAKYFYSSNKYAYTHTSKGLLITTHKDLGRQWDTAVRVRYPNAHRRPENVLIQTLVIASVILLPFVLLPFVIFNGYLDGIYATFVIVAGIMYLLAHVLISLITNPTSAYLAPVNFPIAISLDVIALHLSMYKYEFSKVIWKGRDVAPHKLHTIKHLPNLE